MNHNRWNPFLATLRNEGGDGGDGGGGGESGGQGGGGTLLNPGNSGDNPAPWYDGLPPELKSAPYVMQSKDLSSFVKSAIDTKSMVGANVIKLPGEKATDEERNAFYDSLGRPKDHAGYKNTVAPKVDTLLDPGVMETMQKTFHGLGLSEKQGQGILDAYMGIINSGYDASEARTQAAYQEGVAALKTDWGVNYDNNVKTAQLALRQLGDEALMKTIDESGLGNNPAFIKFMHAVGVKLLDDEAIGGDGGGAFGGTPMAAQQEIERLKIDMEFQTALNTAAHPGHKAAVDRWENLFRQAYPGKAQE